MKKPKESRAGKVIATALRGFDAAHAADTKQADEPVRLDIRLSRRERDEMQNVAASLGLTVSDYLRYMHRAVASRVIGR